MKALHDLIAGHELLFSAVAAAAVFALTVWLTAGIRDYALRRGLSDIPNARSLHSAPTPRGGGLAIAIGFFVALLLLTWQQLILSELAWALIGGGGLVAWIGWRDDHGHVAIKWRLLVHALAAIWGLFWLGDTTFLNDGLPSLWLWLERVVIVLGIIWLTNLYNFMDGSDGLAGAQALCSAGAGSFLLYLSGAEGLALVALMLAAASAGFLIWNWPPAKIFMGDVGSGLLGFSFALLALAADQHDTVPLLLWALLLAVFLLDATFTLAARIWRKEPWYAAHRSHTYQRLIQAGCSHQQVLLGLLAVNVAVLWPLTWWVWTRPTVLPVMVLAVTAVSWWVWFGVRRRYPAS